MDDWERRRLAEDQTRASDRAAAAGEKAAIESRALRREVESMRREAELREKEQDRRERERVFGSPALCVSFIKQALAINPALKTRLRDHYAGVLRDTFALFWGRVKSHQHCMKQATDKPGDLPASLIPTIQNGIEELGTNGLPGIAASWKVAFGPLPDGAEQEIDRCRQEAVVVRGRATEFQAHRARRQKRRSVLNAIGALIIVATFVLAFIMIVEGALRK